MKQIFGYMEYDMRYMKQSLMLMAGLFGFISLWMGLDNALMPVIYMLFGGIVIASTPFGIIKDKAVTFSALLPGTTIQRILGRYLFGAVMLLFSAAYGLLVSFLIHLAGFENMGNPLTPGQRAGETELLLIARLVVIIFGIALVFVAIQNTLLYLLGGILGAQFLSLVRMVPGFCMFFGTMALLGHSGSEDMSGFAAYLINHTGMLAAVILSAGIVCYGIGIFLSWLIMRRRDAL